MRHSIHLITILIPIIAILSLSGCGSGGSSNTPEQTGDTSVYSPPQPAVTNAEERPPAVPMI